MLTSLPQVRAEAVLLVLVLLPAALQAGVDTAWVRRYDGPAHGDDWAARIAVDSAGNVHVTGTSSSDTSSSARYLDFVTIKYYPNGDTAWVRRQDFGGKDVSRGLGVDAQGNVYVAGTCNDDKMVTIKYSPSGTLLWSKMFGSQGGATGLALDRQNNVLVCGYSMRASMDAVLLKYRPNGDTAWARFLDWAGHEDYAVALAVGVHSDVAVVDEGYDGSSGSDYVTAKYDSAGVQQWVAAYHGPSDWDTPIDVAMDTGACVYVTGNSEGTTSSYDYLTIKYSPQGETLWTSRYDGPQGGTDRASAVAVDMSGCVLVTGTAQFETGNRDYATAKYDSAGAQMWVARYDGPARALDEAYGMVVDGFGNAYVTGGARVEQYVSGCVTIKYDPDRDTVWVATYVAPPFAPDYGTAIAIDADGCVYVAGIYDNDILSIKYVQSGGVAEENVSPGNFSLVARPSVFSSWTELQHSVGHSTATKPQVFDAMGRRVTQAKPGVYFVLEAQAQAGHKLQAVRKVVLIE